MIREGVQLPEAEGWSRVNSKKRTGEHRTTNRSRLVPIPQSKKNGLIVSISALLCCALLALFLLAWVR